MVRAYLRSDSGDVGEVQARGAEASKVARAEALAHLTSMRAALLEGLLDTAGLLPAKTVARARGSSV